MGEVVDTIEQEIASEFAEGQSPIRRKRKATPVSRMMEARNHLVKRSGEEIKELDENIETAEAVNPTIDDSCNNAIPTCDKSYMYRNVTGTCNNIENPFYGSADIGRRRN